MDELTNFCFFFFLLSFVFLFYWTAVPSNYLITKSEIVSILVTS